uniref:Uncharacterized protein n=1 Tax=Lotus japonicus TaxID=34305 RepID=I3SU38_LOTJA|nr:unknown [Lotus japonicus]
MEYIDEPCHPFTFTSRRRSIPPPSDSPHSRRGRKGALTEAYLICTASRTGITLLKL